MAKNLAKICMLADSHALFDDRIYWKEAVSLKKAGYDVHVVLAAEKDESGITEEGIGYEAIRRDRYPGKPFLNYLAKRLPGGLYSKMFRKSAELKADVYHFQDLKVNRIGGKIQKLPHGPKLVYDVHEPYPENILDYWPEGGMRGLLKKFMASYVRWWERRAVSGYDLIITTEENLEQRFRSYFPGKQVEIIYNYTNLPKVAPEPGPVDKVYDAIYTGGVTEWRGAWQIVRAVEIARKEKPDLRVLFLGTWFPARLKEDMQSFISRHGLDESIDLKDAVPYNHVPEYYRQSRIGLGIFLPIRTHRIILQIKIFEYLNFGLPILGSNFGHIARIIGAYDCGVTVDPLDPGDIARKLIRLLTDEEAYREMRENSIRAAGEHFRWEQMEIKLRRIYSNLTGITE